MKDTLERSLLYYTSTLRGQPLYKGHTMRSFLYYTSKFQPQKRGQPLGQNAFISTHQEVPLYRSLSL